MSLLVAGALALGSMAAGGLANKKAAEATAAGRKAFTDYYNSEYYKNPEDNLGTRALLKAREERREEDINAINNKAAAGGATIENQLAARKAMNRDESQFESQMLLSQEARRQALSQQKMAADQQAYAQDAQNWQSWGANMSSSLMSLGGLAALGSGGGSLLAGKTLHGGLRPAGVPFVPGTGQVEKIAAKPIGGLING